MALVAFTQVDSGIVAAHAREIGSAPLRIDETQDINVVAKAARHVRDTQDRLSILKSCSLHWFFARYCTGSATPRVKASLLAWIQYSRLCLQDGVIANLYTPSTSSTQIANRHTKAQRARSRAAKLARNSMTAVAG